MSPHYALRILGLFSSPKIEEKVRGNLLAICVGDNIGEIPISTSRKKWKNKETCRRSPIDE
jgi:hypothetical protein